MSNKKNARPKFNNYIKELLWVNFFMAIFLLVIIVISIKIHTVEYQKMLIVYLIIFAWFVLYTLETSLRKLIKDIVANYIPPNAVDTALPLPQIKDFDKRTYVLALIFILLFGVTSYFTHVLFTKIAWGAIVALSIYLMLLREYSLIDKFLIRFSDFLSNKSLHLDILSKTRVKSIMNIPFLEDWLMITGEGIALVMFLFFIGNLFSILNENHLWFVYIFVGTIYVIARRTVQLINYLNGLSDELGLLHNIR